MTLKVIRSASVAPNNFNQSRAEQLGLLNATMQEVIKNPSHVAI